MEKKKYMKPSMKVYAMQQSRIICTSNTEPTRRSPNGYGDEMGYIPGFTDDTQLA